MTSRKLANFGFGLVAAGVFTFGAAAIAGAQTAPQAQAPANPPPPAAQQALPAIPPPPPAPAVDPDTSTDADAFRAVGFYVARQNRLNVNFNEQQIAWMAEGFKNGLGKGDMPASFKDDITRAQMIFRAKMEQVRKIEQAEAIENERLGQAYIDSLPNKDKLTRTESGLYYEILAPGNADRKPQKFDRVKVNYKGTLINGTVFDESKEPIEFAVAGVVPGMSEGLQLIGEGGKIRLYVPGNLGYGTNVPPGAKFKPGEMLVFELEIVSVTQGHRPPALGNMNQGRPNPGMPPTMTPPPPPPGFKDRVPPAPPSTLPPSTTPPPLPPEALKNKPTTPPPPPAPEPDAPAATK